MSKEIDWEKITGCQPWIEAGIGDRVVTWDEWCALLAEYKVYRRLTELQIQATVQSQADIDHYLDLARSEIAEG